MDAEIRVFAGRVRRRLREQSVVRELFWWTTGGLLLSLILSLVSLAVPFPMALPFIAVVLALSVIGGMAAGVLKAPTLMESALRADEQGRFEERVSTALFLQGREDAFSVLQKKDAVSRIRDFRVRKEFPVRIRKRQAALFLALAILLGVSGMADTPARQTARVQSDVKRTGKEKLARLEKVEQRLKEQEGLSETELLELEEQLERTGMDLKEAQSYEDLKKAEERFLKKLEMAAEQAEPGQAKEALQKAAQESLAAEQAEQEQLAQEAQEALEKAEDGDRRDKQEAYEKLKKLSELSGDQNLGKKAEAYQKSGFSSGERADARQALSENQKNLTGGSKMADGNNSQTGSQTGSQNSSQSGNQNGSQNGNQNGSQNGNQNGSQNGNQNGNQNDSQNGNQNSNQNGSQNGNQNGNQNGSQNGNQNGGQNGNSGNQNGGRNGNGNNGGGSGNGGTGTGGGSGWNYGSKEGREGYAKTRENITIPEGVLGEDENLTGIANGNQTSQMVQSEQSRAWSGNKVSYGEVSGAYKEKAIRKIDGSNYPGKLKEQIRNYFDGLD